MLNPGKNYDHMGNLVTQPEQLKVFTAEDAQKAQAAEDAKRAKEPNKKSKE